MVRVLNLEELVGYYQWAVSSLVFSGTLTLAKGIELALHLYQNVRVAGVLGIAADDDMLLFQYGILDWGDKNGRYFGLDLTRQLTLVEPAAAGEEEECCLYQLRYEFQFDPAPFEACKSYNSWSGSGSSLMAWAATQQETPGFQLARTHAFRTLEISLTEV